MKITVPTDCGNAPRKELIRDFKIAFSENDIEKTLEFLADDIKINFVGNKILSGKEEVMATLKSVKGEVATELIVNCIVTHSDSAASDGILRFGDKDVAFCDVYKFSGHGKNAKIKYLSFYGIEAK